LWFLWSYEHEHTAIRAPGTGVTLAASVFGFVTVGLTSRSWRAVLAAAGAAVMAALLVDPLVWRTEPVDPAIPESCDPGCISLEPFAAGSAVVAAALASLGILLRRTTGKLRLRRQPRARMPQ
jgi:hypothetical protein